MVNKAGTVYDAVGLSQKRKLSLSSFCR